jgi:hypothetical protein
MDFSEGEGSNRGRAKNERAEVARRSLSRFHGFSSFHFSVCLSLHSGLKCHGAELRDSYKWYNCQIIILIILSILCFYLLFTLLFTFHFIIYFSLYYLLFTLLFTFHFNIYFTLLYLLFTLLFTFHFHIQNSILYRFYTVFIPFLHHFYSYYRLNNLWLTQNWRISYIWKSVR